MKLLPKGGQTCLRQIAGTLDEGAESMTLMTKLLPGEANAGAWFDHTQTLLMFNEDTAGGRDAVADGMAQLLGNSIDTDLMRCERRLRPAE